MLKASLCRPIRKMIFLFYSFATTECIVAQQSHPAVSAGAPTQSSATGSDDLATQANDPSSPLRQVQFLDSYSPLYFGPKGEGNNFNLRPVLPDKIGNVNTITRPTLQLDSTPDGRTGLGDTIVLSVAVFEITPHFRIGGGPILIAPSATNRSSGEGKWQLGPSLLLITTPKKGLILGLLEENPISFTGESARADVNHSIMQPVVVKTLMNAYFIRLDPTLDFDWERGGAATIPVNFGLGRLFKLGAQPMNAYVQPEWNVHRPAFSGSTASHFVMRFSLTLLFPKKT